MNAGVVQNTPGGGTGGLSGTVGSGVGGTSVGSAGIGSGTNGLVNSTLGIGAPITSFDPIVSGTLQFDHDSLLSSSAFSAPVTKQNTTTTDISYVQGFQWGTNMSVGFNNSRVTTNSPFSALSPNLAPNFQLRLTQSLLQGFGFAPNTRFIRIAKNNREITDVAFRLQVITTVDQIENIYWDLVYAYQNVKVQEEAKAFAEKTLEDNKKQVQAGVLPPIQIVSAENTVATDDQALILARTNLELQELLMKNALTRTLDDPVLAEASVIPTSTMQLPAQEPVIPTRELINDALSHRAELSESRIDLTNRAISNKAVRNALLPTLDLFAYYGGAGLGGMQNAANLCAPPPQPQRLGCRTTAAPTVSYGSTVADLFDSTAPDKGLGLTLNIPLRNRAAQADQVRAQLEYRQAQMRFQQIQNQVGIEVRNAQFALQQNRAAVRSAQTAVEFARQTLDSEQKKLAAGVSNPTAVLQDQAGLTTAESNVVSAMAAYEKSRVEMDRATGLLLDHSGIVVADAQRGQVVHMPAIPDVTSNPEPVPATPAAPAHADRKLMPHSSRRARGFSSAPACPPAGECVIAGPALIRYPLSVKLSVVLITHNEELNLARTLKSVQPLVRDGKGEIVIVDSGSTDGTVGIAHGFGATIFVEEWKGYAAQKNSAIEKASGDWILSLDADEELDHDLQASLAGGLESLELIANFEAQPCAQARTIEDARIEAGRQMGTKVDREFAGLWIPRKNEFLGRWIKHGGFWPDPKLRFFRRGTGKFEERPYTKLFGFKARRGESAAVPSCTIAIPPCPTTSIT